MYNEKYICKFCNRICKNKKSLVSHERLCKNNPEKKKTNFEDIEWQRKNGFKQRKHHWKCNYCDEEFETVKQLNQHKHLMHKIQNPWNKGLTKETDERIVKSAITLKENIKNGKLIRRKVIVTNETKHKISEGMKKAHQERRAGEWLGRNKKSYAEQFFEKVIQNEFLDKNYVFNYHFDRYWLDFAWIEKKKYIEIDGQQHERFEYQRKNDELKDALLKENGWKVLRIKWKDLFHDPKIFIEKAKQFIDADIV